VRSYAIVLSLLGVLALLAPAAAGAASGDEPGVHVDPDSPAGKEYAIPLERARQEATGTGRSNRAGGPASGGSASGTTGTSGTTGIAGKAPLFGEGIQSGQGGGGFGGGPGSGRNGPAAAASTGGNGASERLTLAGLTGAVLVLGAAAGLLLRRTLRRE
jgi:hypothetical protein